jgi:hypothetical protein
MSRVFISYDYDHDAFLKEALVGQSRNSDSPFEISDWSIKTASSAWRTEALFRIRRSDAVAVICGYHTHTAEGVSVELTLARQEGKPYFLLQGHADGCTRPSAAWASDKVYEWNWANLKALVGGAR